MTEMVNANLEKIITFSCGIGYSMNEAEEASERAKERKNEFHNYLFYEGEPKLDNFEKNHEAIDAFKELTNILAGVSVGLSALDVLTCDSLTGLYTRARFEFELAKYDYKNQGYFIYLDGDNMKGWNDKVGHERVDILLSVAGRAIKNSIRGEDRRVEKKEKPEEKRGEDRRSGEYQLDLVGCRIHGSGGDEFVVYVPLERNGKNKALVEKITERIINNVYSSQLDYVNR